ncbi:MAG: hypothetical protein MUO62_13785, partial [Anaerolineales bacterium]|nr:hypothetical protein [Anaerolineales bacterium]
SSHKHKLLALKANDTASIPSLPTKNLSGTNSYKNLQHLTFKAENDPFSGVQYTASPNSILPEIDATPLSYKTMTEVIIRPYHICDSQAVEDITYRTGFKGEDLFGRNYFDDKRLLYLILIYYYPKFEPEHCFVAADVRTRQVVGFICGTADTIHQEKIFGILRVLVGALVALMLVSAPFWNWLSKKTSKPQTVNGHHARFRPGSGLKLHCWEDPRNTLPTSWHGYNWPFRAGFGRLFHSGLCYDGQRCRL